LPETNTTTAKDALVAGRPVIRIRLSNSFCSTAAFSGSLG
jgi:hypothetical protein